MSTEDQNIARYYYSDIFFLGFTLIGAQIILIREFLLIFNGNELIIGLLFSVWMITTAFGSWLGRFFSSRKSYQNLIRILMVFVAVYPLFAAFCIEYFRNIVFENGRMISLYEALIYSIVILLPVCSSGGLLFTLINHSYSEESRIYKNLYSVESIGSLVGGLLISLYFIYQLGVNNFRSLTYLLLINFVYFGISDFKIGKQFRSFVFLVFAIGIMFFIYNIDLHRKAKEMLFYGQELIFSKETPYGNLSITRTEKQINIYKDGVIYCSSDNVIQKEEDVHYTMLQNPRAKTVLLIGGGISGSIQELLKYPSVQQITYLEMDPALFNLVDDNLIDSSKVIIQKYAIDPVIFVQNTTQTFDVIIVNQPPPSNAQINRFYTVNFYQKLKKIINPDGLISSRLPSSANYLSDDEVSLQATIYNSLNVVFNHVIIVPGSHTYFIASDKVMSVDYAYKISGLALDNDYVNTNYLNDDLLRFRSEQTLATYTGTKTLNYNLKPVVYVSYIQHWLNYYHYNFWLIPIIVLALTLVFFIFSKPNSLSIFASGFTGAGVEIILIIVFQVLLGYMYLFIGVLITIFMAGLAIGSWVSKKTITEKAESQTSYLQFFSGTFIIGLAGVFLLLERVNNPLIIQVIIIFSMLIIAILVGWQYGLSISASKSKTGKTVSNIYASDLAGSAIGSLAVVIFLIPILGIYFSLYCLAGLHFLTLLVNFFKKKIQYL